MYEVEVKIPTPVDGLRDRFRSKSDEVVGTILQHDTYYDHPVESFAETDEALRLRRTESVSTGETSTVLTYKGPLVDTKSKTRKELESGIDAPDRIHRILHNLGFEPVATIEKERERFRFGESLVSIDTIESLGTFVEIERSADEAEIDRARSEVLKLAERLDLDVSDQTRQSYLEMHLEVEE